MVISEVADISVDVVFSVVISDISSAEVVICVSEVGVDSGAAEQPARLTRIVTAVKAAAMFILIDISS
jgi:hypothetical protein